jgi:MFS transporter
MLAHNGRTIAIIVGACAILLFFFLPESFWDRTHPPRNDRKRSVVQTTITRQPTKLGDQKSDGMDIEPDNSPETPNSTGKDDFVMNDSKMVVENIELTNGVNSTSRLDLNDIETGLPGPIIQRNAYTDRLRESPPRSFVDTLRPFNGRIRNENWFKVAIRPFILCSYPAVLWSGLVYGFSVGWLILLSEAISEIYREKDYHFTSFQVGLVYISPFIGALFGSGASGKVSDIVCRYMAKRNNGVFEPEFRLVMTPVIALCTAIGLMGFGWSAEIHDSWIVPTVFFGVISFGCSLGASTGITFCVDSYKEYAGEALVTLCLAKSKSQLARHISTANRIRYLARPDVLLILSWLDGTTRL